MLYNYLKIALRLFARNKLISTINVMGLALALTGGLLIAIFIQDELSYDRYHTRADDVYRVTRNFLSPDGSVTLHLGHLAPPFGPLLKNDFSDIEEVARTRGFYRSLSLIEEDGTMQESIYIENSYYAEPAVFRIFSIPILAGDTKTTLEKPNTMMVSDATALQYFGTVDVVGKRFRAEDDMFEITGVYEAFPAQSHWHPDILVAFNTLNDENVYGREQLETNWGNNNFATYILVNEDFDPEQTEAQFPDFLDKHMGQSDNPVQPSMWTNLFLQPLTSIHLHSQLDSEIEANGSINHVYTMGAIGVFLILIACFNFINLSTARATTRGKEVGLRKVVGAFKKQLITQHLSESVLIAFFSFLLAIVLISLALPWLNDFTGKSIALQNYANPAAIAIVLTAMLLIGIMAGLYPAFVISGFKPVVMLKGKSTSTKSSNGIRKALVVVQFSISIIMIIATLITYQQLNFLNDRELGYSKDQIVRIYYDDAMDERYETFYHELTKSPSIINASRSSIIPTGRLLDYQGSLVQQGDSLVATDIAMKDVRIDHDFFDTYQIPLVSGRNFSKDIKSDDSLAFIINETAAKMVGWSSEEAIGQVLQNGPVKGTVIGVVKDFHFESLHEPIVPVVFHGQHNFNNVSVLVSEAEMQEALAHIESLWKEFMPDIPFSYNFLSERYAHLYDNEQSQNELFMIFAGLAIFIASMGLFGLATFNTHQRSKEVSIRKVLGAPLGSILGLLSKEILLLILIANLLAWPVAWYFMREWLSRFAYHTEMNIFTYLLAAVLAIVITLVTISSQTIKAALTNPATVLRND
ncbi:ABC transporter permease [Catalinimonas niigatensis]|uniref:ABC transporter permease n=1 Tax=Catalinimonas niigatensis TaxID=1397264 RepID=UPI0026661623|nr:ABC transporter permease [Catalinimonas niigatensis]WPP49705.1 FtsX-like permease family protein [Catalinimonas niigatensis]